MEDTIIVQIERFVLLGSLTGICALLHLPGISGDCASGASCCIFPLVGPPSLTCVAQQSISCYLLQFTEKKNTLGYGLQQRIKKGSVLRQLHRVGSLE